MADKYFVTHADMLGVADEIRAKSGSSDALVFPDGWKDAIKALGGGGVETVQVTIDVSNWYGYVFYTDGNYQFKSLELSDGSTLITCLKESAVIFTGSGFSADIASSYEIDYMADMDGDGMYIYHFTNSATISIENGEDADEDAGGI